MFQSLQGDGGESVREIALYCHNINPQYSDHYYRKWLRALEQQADGPIAKYREQDHAQKAIEEFNKLKTKPDSLVAKLEPEPPSYEVMRRLHRNVNTAPNLICLERPKVQVLRTPVGRAGFILPQPRRKQRAC
jgi:hypothetical protein